MRHERMPVAQPEVHTPSRIVFLLNPGQVARQTFVAEQY